MITLAIDTSCLTATCATVNDGKVLSEFTTQHGKTHSQKILPMIMGMLDMLDMSFNDVDLFAAAIGPGSFTGLRIGVVTIKGLAYPLNKPVCGIPTLDALAYSVPDFKGIIAPMLDARNNQIFTALFKKENNLLNKLTPDMGVHIEEWIEIVQNHDKDILVVGDAIPLHLDKIRAALGEKIIEASHSLHYPRASATALLAEQAFYNNKSVNAFELEPLYLRKSQAERMKENSSVGDTLTRY